MPVAHRACTQPEILGTLSVGFLLDDALAAQLKQITGSDIAFGMDGQILASHAAARARSRAGRAPRARTASRALPLARRGIRGAAAAARPSAGDGDPLGAGPVALILRSRTEQLQSLDAIHTGLAVTAVLAVAARDAPQLRRRADDHPAAGGDHRRHARGRGDRRPDAQDRAPPRQPLGRRRRAAAGDDVQHADRFDRAVPARDVAEGAAVVARPAVDGDRARSPQPADDHQGGAARAAAAGRRAPTAVREAAADIDDEVVAAEPASSTRCSTSRGRSASSCAPADLNALCRESATAAHGVRSRRRRSPASSIRRSPRSTTDAERLRIALVNLLVNARHAVNGTSRRDEPARRSQRRRRSTLAAEHASADRVRSSSPTAAPASTPRTCAHIFDPYFTTKRGGTGLGLPIAKNIVEGLGGTIAVASAPGARHRDSHRTPVDDARHAVRRRSRSIHDTSRLDPARRRRRKNPQGARPRAARRRPRGGRDRRARARRSGCSRERTFDVLLVDNVMPELSGLDLIREFVGVDARGRAAADPDDDGARHGRERDRGDEARRARLPAEAVRDRRAAGRRPARARAPAPAHRVPLPASASATSSSTTTASSAAAARWRK